MSLYVHVSSLGDIHFTSEEMRYVGTRDFQSHLAKGRAWPSVFCLDQNTYWAVYMRNNCPFVSLLMTRQERTVTCLCHVYCLLVSWCVAEEKIIKYRRKNICKILFGGTLTLLVGGNKGSVLQNIHCKHQIFAGTSTYMLKASLTVIFVVPNPLKFDAILLIIEIGGLYDILLLCWSLSQ